jgi:4'-phosphopantetheinyl transferase
VTVRVAVARWPEERIQVGDVEALVYVSSLRDAGGHLQTAIETLSRVERERHALYANEIVARRYAIGRSTTRAILGHHLGMDPASIPLRHEPQGKPVLAERDASAARLWFSVAHSDDIQLVALSATCDVGVDVERSRAIEHWERVADRVLDPLERRQLAQSVEAGEDAGAAFLRLWCRVEAELKAIGCGIQGLEAHRAGVRPAGYRVRDLHALPLPSDLAAAGRQYQAAVALCAPRTESLRASHAAAAQQRMPAISPATASTA